MASSELRDQLDAARRGYRHVGYPGDLAADVFARLDAGERHAADERLDGVDAATLQEVHAASRMRIGPGSAVPRRTVWQPILAVAAAVAVLAATIGALVHFTGRDDGKTVAVKPPTPPVVTGATPEGQKTEPKADDATTVATAEENTEFRVVPTFQSFSFSMPSSLTIASVDEYDRQAREAATQAGASATTANDAATATKLD